MSLIQGLVRLLGFHFVPDNHVVPVLRGGLYHRVAGPGYFFVTPLFEEVKDPILTAIKGDTYNVTEVRTRDGISLTMKLTVRYRFDPKSLSQDMARKLLMAGPQPKTVAVLLADLVEHELRRLVGTRDLSEMWQSDVRDEIESSLAQSVAGQMKRLGVFLREQTPVIIKDIVTLPELTQAMQAAKRHQILLNVLRAYEEADVDQALMAELVSGLSDNEGNVSIMALGEMFGLNLARGRSSGPDEEAPSDSASRVIRFRRRMD